MSLSAREIARLRRIIAISENLIANSPKPKRGRPASKSDNGDLKSVSRRTRRTGKDLAEFRKILRTERKKGMPVAQIAKKHGISTAYVYQL
jgi:hypothetical protein